MRAILFERFGGPEVLREVELPCPQPGPGQLLVRVKASSINPVDLQTRRGDYASLAPAPGRLGVDVAGIVEALGEGVTEFRKGDEVYYSPRLLANEGSYADYHVEDAAIVARKPATLSFSEAATLPLAGGTAWECLVERGRIQPGELVLVHGATGGVGVYAIQIARAAGAVVVASCRSENADRARQLGADFIVDYRDNDFAGRLGAVLDGRGLDLILDTVGGATIETSLALLSPFGRLVSIVDQPKPQNLVRGWEKNATLHFVLTTQSRARLDRLRGLVDHGRLKPVIERELPLSEAARAHALVEAGGRQGKIVLNLEL